MSVCAAVRRSEWSKACAEWFMEDKSLTSSLAGITQALLEANVAIPVVAAAIGAIVLIIRGLTGTGPSLAELPALIEAQVAKTGATVDANLAAATRAALGLPVGTP